MAVLNNLIVNGTSRTLGANYSYISCSDQFIKTNGTSYQFLKADGSVDDSAYLTQLIKGTTSGSGNAVTDISVNVNSITLTKGSTFLTSSHTYPTSIATSTGTNQLTLIFGTKYALTAGGTSYIFTMPSKPTYTASEVGTIKLFKGTCDTPGSTLDKDVVCPEFKSSDLVQGAIIFVTFTNANTGAVSSITMNVNGTGKKSIRKLYNTDGAAKLVKPGELAANSTYMFQYNGNYWVCMTLNYNNMYGNNTLGSGFVIDSRSWTETTIIASYSGYILQKGGRISILMKFTNTSDAQLDINESGAKNIKYYNSSGTLTSIPANVIPANSIAEFIYDGTQYIYLGYYKYGETSVDISEEGASTTNYYLMGAPISLGTTLYRYGTSGPYMLGNQLYAGSDLAYKKDIKPISNNFVNQLFEQTDITYDFTWKDSNSNSSGFIAQWIEDIMPEVVNGADGEKHVNYDAALSKVVGAIFKKIQEQQNQIDELIKQNKEIKKELENIRNISEK